MAKSVDPDQMPHSAASDLGLHFLLKYVCHNTLGFYGTLKIKNLLPRADPFSERKQNYFDKGYLS